MKGSLLAVVACLLTGGPAFGLVGSELVDPASYPEVVVIRDKNASCFGVAIAPNAVLTSAVCISEVSFVQFKRVGENISDLAPAYWEGQSRLTCIPVGDPNNGDGALAICRVELQELQFAILAGAAEVNTKDLTVFGKQCEMPDRLGQSFAIAAREVELQRVGPNKWIGKGITPCFGDQGAPGFLALQDTDIRKKVAGIVTGLRQTDSDGYSVELTMVKLDSQTRIELSRAASQLDVDICGINYGFKDVEKRHCTYLPIPEFDPEPILNDEREGVTHIPGESTLDLVERACKFATPDHLALMETYLGEDYAILIRQPIPADQVENGIVSLPVCPNSTRIETRVVFPGERPSDYFAKGPARLGFDTLGPVDGSDLASFHGAFWRLNPGMSGKLVPGETVKIPVIEPPPAAAPIDDSSGSTALDRPLLTASFPSGSVDYACASATSPDPMHYPFDISELMLALYTNQQLRSGPATMADVMIADTGLFLKDGASGTKEYFAVSNSEDSDAVPLILNVRDATHGTQVASVALGGPFLAQLWSVTGARRINIRSVRIFSYSQRFEDFSTQLDAIARAAKDYANIINFSVTGTDRTMYGPLENGLNQRWPLFVVAAGNKAGRTDGVTTVALPGDLGGDNSHNLISVANLDGTSTFLHRTSSYHPKKVDIAAPGCQVPVIGWEENDYVIQRATGSSVAAPLVSFVAALIFAEGREKTAAEIKQRVVISADLSPLRAAEPLHVSNTVRDGRRLNIVKAVSLHQDLIEVPKDFGEPGSLLLQGVVRFLQDGVEDGDRYIQFSDCGDDPVRDIKPGAILKLWPFDEGRRLRIYYQPKAEGTGPNDPLFESATCAPPANLTLEISTTKETATVTLPELIDFVRSSR